ncbi:DUF2304 domain-containing protein [Cellulomonas telluris]|uniref:DUF2304 domain-containing protein n=1 Tax=Cellulomonas telluris TaxID=2306636 RepID=UPI0010A90202|nr:DUF2304 domain-containing protein [Cellulomonas telluris]
MSGYAFAVGACVALVVFLVVLLRTRRLREKYAVTWILLGSGVVVLAAFPRTAETLASAVGVQTPSNLLFAIALMVLLLVCIQLSVEITGLEEETRTLAEEVALLRLDVERALRKQEDRRSDGPTASPVVDGTPLEARRHPVLGEPVSGD